MLKTNSNMVQREYNIISGAPNKFFSGSTQPFTRTERTGDLFQINQKRREALLEKQKDNFKLVDIQPVRNTTPFENVLDTMRSTKTYEFGIPSKISMDPDLNRRREQSIINSSSLNYDFLSYTLKKDPKTLQGQMEANPNAARRKAPISTFDHIGRVTSPNPNPNYQFLFRNDTTVFRKKQGLGSEYLNSARSYGALTKTFKRAGK